jgi:SAM-dependent methyltransferase
MHTGPTATLPMPEASLEHPSTLTAGTRCLYYLARWAKRRSAVHTPADLQRTTCEARYRSWRSAELKQQLERYFEAEAVRGLDVLDFGCGTGELCSLLAQHRPRSLVGVDKSARAIVRARESADADLLTPNCRPVFICNERHDRIPVADRSIDLVCCFDAVEHIPDMQAVALEWRRVLRPGGRVWIWWSPWRAPYGHHLESLIPLPWVHLLLPARTIFAACAALYDNPDYVPRKWDIDPATGEKMPNKWRNATSFHPFLNRLTRRRFEEIIRGAGWRPARCETHGFSGSSLTRATRAFLRVPVLGECFVSFYVYELRR